MLKLEKVSLIDEVQIEITPAEQESAWQETQGFSNSITRYSAYLDCLILKTFLRWLKESESEEENSVTITVFPEEKKLINFWEFVTGIAVNVGDKRLVLVAGDELETDVLRVPQEWVDNPQWLGDYYVGIGVNLDGDEDECWLSLRGFTTHRFLKNEATYNPVDRTYSLRNEALKDWVLMELMAKFDVREEVAALPILGASEVASLINFLANKKIYSPRLCGEISFEKWAALISNEQWRKQLSEKRLEMAKLEKSVVNLRAWLLGVVDAGWELVEELDTAIAEMRRVSACQLISAPSWRNDEPELKLEVSVSQNIDAETTFFFRVSPTSREMYLPEELNLKVIDEDGNIIEEKQLEKDTPFVEFKVECEKPRERFYVVLSFKGYDIFSKTFEL